jgi:hypothetical protein
MRLSGLGWGSDLQVGVLVPMLPVAIMIYAAGPIASCGRQAIQD